MPSRSCVACRTSRPKRDLIRVVRTPDGSVVVDPSGRVAGRGAYVCDDPACIAKAITKGALGRALSTPLPSELREALVAGVPNTHNEIEGGARGQK